MIHNNLNRAQGSFNSLYHKMHNVLLCDAMFNTVKSKSFIHSRVGKSSLSSPQCVGRLHMDKKQEKNRHFNIFSLVSKRVYLFCSTSPKQSQIDYNSFRTIQDLQILSGKQNKFHCGLERSRFLSSQYQIITMNLERKLQRIEEILQSPQRNLYKIVEQIVIVLEAFSKTNRREIVQENVIKVVKEFRKKLISAYLQNIQAEQLQQIERKNNSLRIPEQTGEQTDSNYLLHENYNSPPPELTQKEFTQLPSNNAIDLNFIFFYIETIKSWLLAKLQNDSIIRQAEQEIYSLFSAREVSALGDTLKAAVQNLTHNYIEQTSSKKRELFPFDIKLRGICLLPFFENKTHIEKYLARLADQNLIIYLKEPQIINIMYDITELKPDLTNNSNSVYQIQSTRVYQNLATLNGAYIKAMFINYTRNFMVSYQQIQFYELFRDIEPKIKYPSIRTFIRLNQILNTQASDLHCEYNKIMNKYNYNIIISIIISQSYNIENTKFEQFLQLFEGLNKMEKAGQILYDEMNRFLKAFYAKQENYLNSELLDRVYKLFLHVIQQTKPFYKYEDKEALNRQYGKKTTHLLNTLFDILLDKYPHIVVTGSNFIKSYLIAQENIFSSLAVLPWDDRQIKIQIQSSHNIQAKIARIKSAFTNVTQEAKQLAIYGQNQNTPYNLFEYLFSINSYLKVNVNWTRRQQIDEEKRQPQVVKLPSQFKLLGNIYPTLPQSSFQQSLFTYSLESLLKQYLNLDKQNPIKKFSNKDSIQIYRNLYTVLEAINLIECKKQNIDLMENYVEQIRNKVLQEMKYRLDQKDQQDQNQRANSIDKLTMSMPKGNIQLLLCLSQLIKLTNKFDTFHQTINTQHHLSSTATTSPQSILISTSSLPIVYNFINKLAIQNFKSISQPDVINMLLFIKSLEEIKASQKQNVLLLQINTLVYEYLYQSLSVFIMYLTDKGKMYLKLISSSLEPFTNVINHFIANKAIFRALPSKKRLVILQTMLVGLIRRKHVKITSVHLKRSQHAKLILSFLQIFEYPENLIVDLRKIVEQAQFLSSDLQQFSNQVLERYSELNWTISRYLDDNNVNLTSSKKLTRLTTEQLRKEFEQGKSSKIYEMIVRNSKYQLPFELPQPKGEDTNAKMVYIIEKIYQKISKRNNYSVPKNSHTRSRYQVENRGKRPQLEQNQSEQAKQLTNEQQQGREEQIIPQTFAQQQYVPKFLDINLGEEKQYIKRESLVNYTYQDHYKMNQNKLPIHFKKQNWKSIYAVAKDLEIETLQIDQKIDENIYKQVLLAFLGYVEKVKLIAKQFHAHSFIQYVAAQLDMEVYYHGCIARISRKNKPEENVLFISAVQTNYKLLYICTHILRQSGQNAYIVIDKTKDTNFRQFLERLLPQPFEIQEPEIVDKVVNKKIRINTQDNPTIKEEL